MNESGQSLGKLIEGYKPNHSLPVDFYNNPAVFEADLKAIFNRHWMYAGHTSQVAEAGQYFLTDFGHESIIVVRGKDDEIRAFANVCRHRGSRICLEPSGIRNTFVCPYHAWTYGLDGQLRSKREMTAGFEIENHGLKPVGIGLFHGLIFINLDPDASDFNNGLEAMDAALRIYQLEKTRVACQRTFTVEANWKLAIENFMECYHCGPAHPEYARSHTLQSPKDHRALEPKMLKEAEEIGYQIAAVEDAGPGNVDIVQHFYSRSALYAPHVTGSESGEAVAPLLGDIGAYGGGAADVQFGPVSFAILYPDHIVLYRFLPTDVNSTDMEIVWLVKESAIEGEDYKLDELTWLWTVTTEADKQIITNNQRGINSKFYEPGPLSEMEVWVSEFNEWYLSQIT